MIKSTFILACLIAGSASAASFRTQNFVITASDARHAEQIGRLAEDYRERLAREWLDVDLSPWREPCPIRCYIDPQYGPGGETSFEFAGKVPSRWKMIVHGPLDRVIDTVLPHEIAHTVFATFFGQRLPPWADEGLCSVVEAQSEREKLSRALRRVLPTQRRLSFQRMLTLREYPRDLVPLYAQGHSLASYLITLGGKERFIRFLQEGLDWSNHQATKSRSLNVRVACWEHAIHRYYGFASIPELESAWTDWLNRENRSIQGNQAVTVSSST